MMSFLNESHDWRWNSFNNSYKDQSLDFYHSDQNLTNESSTVVSKHSQLIVVVSITITQTILTIIGTFLQFLIIYYEHFGRDSQKRPLLNRVSAGKCTLFPSLNPIKI